MLTIRGIYDGNRFRALPNELLPTIHREVPVAIVFLEDISIDAERRQHQTEVAKRMRAARNAMPSLTMSVKDLIEEGRER